jgi:Putative prokaryotic signal transducing protein
MKTVKSFSTELEANLAKIELEAAGVSSVVVGIGVAMQGGAAGVQLLVPDQSLEGALKVLEDRAK